ncbi:MAG: DUF4062 domain-containing protein [bacterium]|nr:DUF4062 domain-containing protein [bacterium]
MFITSTSKELDPYQAAVCDAVSEPGHEPVLRDPNRGRGLTPGVACSRQVRGADALLAVVAAGRYLATTW